ncbi:MAG: hypothetical protein ABI227_10130 [Rhodanobacter sp.]
MRKQYILANAILWAAAIVAAAAVAAPVFLSLVLLPTLATLSLLMAGPDACLNRSDIS